MSYKTLSTLLPIDICRVVFKYHDSNVKTYKIKYIELAEVSDEVTGDFKDAIIYHFESNDINEKVELLKKEAHGLAIKHYSE